MSESESESEIPADIQPIENDNLILLCGKPATGKSAALRSLPDPKGVLYLNCEANKKLPFRSKFYTASITDPDQVEEGFIWAETKPEFHTIVLDSLDFLMNMFESTRIIPASEKQRRAEWQNYAQYFLRLMQHHVARSTKNIVIIAHTHDVLNESEGIMQTKVPIKGAMDKVGVEAFFSCIVSTKKMQVKKLSGYESPMLTLNEMEEALGFKYVVQTKLTKDTVHESMREPMGMWSMKETFIDNDIQHIINRLHEYYEPDENESQPAAPAA